jgi:adenylosuccinate synthase
MQFGSTGKGLIAGYLAKRDQPDTVVTAWAPNAGHTYIDDEGRKFVHTQLANGIVSPALRQVLIGPGSVIDPQALMMELINCDEYVRQAAILIHPSAAVVTQQHRNEEAGPMTKIGSTKKGVGAAMIHRIRRNPDNSNIARDALRGTPLHRYVVTRAEYCEALERAKVIQVEGAQGYSLSIYHGMYPYCTSRDVTTAQTIADAGIPCDWITRVVGTMRTYPIRVANRYDDGGRMVGWSGPWYDDSKEIDWVEIGRAPELTTVTKLQRRIATFSVTQMREAVWQNGINDIFLNFVNYCRTRGDIARFVQWLEPHLQGSNARVRWLGDGPQHHNVHDMGAIPASLEALSRMIGDAGICSQTEEYMR